MAAAIAIDALLHQQCVWRGQLMALPPSLQPTGHAELDATLPTGGWPEAARSELLIPKVLLPMNSRIGTVSPINAPPMYQGHGCLRNSIIILALLSCLE